MLFLATGPPGAGISAASLCKSTAKPGTGTVKVRLPGVNTQAAIADIREYVALYYNSKRLHSTLGYKTPMNYEKNLNKVSGNS